MRTRARWIVDFRNGTGQPASAFGGVVGLRIDLGQDARPAVYRLRAARGGCTNRPNWPKPIMRNEANFRRSFKFGVSSVKQDRTVKCARQS